MNDDKQWLNELAGAVLDGTPADLEGIESDATESQRAALRQIKIVARIASVHRSASADLDASASGSLDEANGQLTSWGRLTIIEEIGRGAFGTVYRAKDPRLDREVALKLSQPRTAIDAVLDEQLTASVIEEGRLLARVHHPNVVTIYDADRGGGRVGLTMELVRGRTLAQVLQQSGPLPASEVAAVGIEICHALAAVHGAGLLHRDIKAQNVMRRDDGRLVLMDFGAGRTLTERGGAGTAMAGTPLYLAPEIFNGQPATVRSDLYSIGVLLYHLLTGSYPVTGRTVREVREGHHQNQRVPLRARRADIPATLAALIERALDPEVAKRYASASDMADALASSAAPAPAIAPRRWLATAAMLLAGAAIVAMFVVAFGGAPSLHDLGRPGQPRQSGPAAITNESTLVVRQVLRPGEYAELGRPSPDGRYFPFVDGNSDLAVKELETGTIHRITNRGEAKEYADGYSAAAISPDSKWIAYAWSTAQGTELRLADLQQAIDDNSTRPAETRVLLRRADVEPIEWSADGTDILALLEQQDGSRQIALVSASDGMARSIKELGTMQPHGVTMSPDGRFVAYDGPQDDHPGMRDIVIVPANGSAEWRLVEHPANDVFPQWTADGGSVLFASTRTGALGLWIVDVWEGRPVSEPNIVSRDMGRMTPLGLTRDGAFFYHLRTGLVDVYTASLDPATGIVTGTPEAVAPNYIGSNISSNWSPDGRYLAYVSIRSPVAADRVSRTLTIRDIETGEERDLWPALAFFIEPHWSPDGRTILVYGYDLEERCCWHQVDVTTGRVTFVVPVDGTTHPPMSAVQWARTGRAVLGVRGTDALVSRALASGVETKLLDFRELGVDRLTPPAQGPGLQYSPDARAIAFSGWIGSGETARTVLRVLAADGRMVELAESSGKVPIFFQGWTPDGSDLLFTQQQPSDQRRDSPTALWRVSPSGGEPRRIGIEAVGLRDVHISPDGTRVTFTAGAETGDVRVMDNFLRGR